MAGVLMAEDVAKIAQGADDGWSGDEIAVEDSPGWRELPQCQNSAVNENNAENGSAREGLGGYKTGNTVGRAPIHGKQVRSVCYCSGEQERRKKPSELYSIHGK
jgi:hypothetical protein